MVGKIGGYRPLPEKALGAFPYPPSQHGFTYVALLVMVAIMSVAVLGATQVWSQARQRDKEQELLFVGHQIREAIGAYYEKSPGGARNLPERLEDLVEDKRSMTTERWLRRLYRDPMTGKPEWGLVKTEDGRIKGVHSLSNGQPLKKHGFKAEDVFENAATYAQWQFVYEPRRGDPPPGAAPTVNVSPGDS